MLLDQANTNFDELYEGDNDSPRLQWLCKQINKREHTIREKKKKASDVSTIKEEQDIEKFTLERNKLLAKQKVQRQYIIPGLANRLNSLDNLLALDQQKELRPSETLGEKDGCSQLRREIRGEAAKSPSGFNVSRLLGSSVSSPVVYESIPWSSSSLGNLSSKQASSVLGVKETVSSIAIPLTRDIGTEQIEKRLIDQYGAYVHKFGVPLSNQRLRIKFNKATYRKEDLNIYMSTLESAAGYLEEDNSNTYMVMSITKLQELANLAKTTHHLT